MDVGRSLDFAHGYNPGMHNSKVKSRVCVVLINLSTPCLTLHTIVRYDSLYGTFLCFSYPEARSFLDSYYSEVSENLDCGNTTRHQKSFASSSRCEPITTK